MKEVKSQCWFTGAESQTTAARDADERIIESATLGRYQLTLDIGIVWQQEKGIYRPSQAKANCARKCLEVVKENRRATPYWIPRDRLEHYLPQLKDKPNFVVCCYEDVIDEIVDHSEKPYLLLENFAQRLGNIGAFAKFKVTLEDQAWARIVDKNELWTILRFLADKKCIQQTPVHAEGISELIDNVYKLEYQMLVGGWDLISEKNQFPQTKKVFIATQFNWPGEDDLHAKTIDAIKVACATCGYIEFTWRLNPATKMSQIEAHTTSETRSAAR